MSDTDTADQVNADDWAAAMSEQATAEAKAQPANIFQPLGEGAKAGAMQDFDMILDIPVQLTVELGRTISIRNLLQLAHGSVVNSAPRRRADGR
jgi:flagellar motor switch protein FliN/FliY